MALEKPRFETTGRRVFAGQTATYTPKTIGEIPDHWRRFYAGQAALFGGASKASYGLWFDVLSGKGTFTYVTAMEVGQFAPLPAGFDSYELAPQKYAVFKHNGNQTNVRGTVDAILKEWLPSSGKQHDRVPDGPDFIEKYGPGFDAATKTIETEVWLPIKG